MKKCMLMALITIFALVSVATLCSADSRRGLTNTSKKGSLLVYPLIKVSPINGEDDNDTIVKISNDYTSKVRLQCQYAWPDSCQCYRFSFTLTANQSIAFSAKTGEDVDGSTLFPRKVTVDPFPSENGQYAGELRCWAIDPSGYPISWNHLSGSAIVYEGPDQTWEYSAWRFAAGHAVGRGNRMLNASGGVSKLLRLTGMPDTYDACPEKLIFNFIKQVTDPTAESYPKDRAENRLTLVPCKQDCVSTPVQANFRIYDENEADNEAIACYDCDDNASSVWTDPSGFYSKSLSDGTKFNWPTSFSNSNRTPGRMAIVENTPSGDCSGAAYGIPFLGVISNKFSGVDGPVAGESLTTLGRAQPYLTIDGSVTDIEVQMSY